MIKLLVSVKDLKAGSWSVPAAADNIACACRMFGDLVKDGRTLVGQHPEDFEIYIVGSFDLSTGSVVCDHEAPRCISRGLDFAKEGE